MLNIINPVTNMNGGGGNFLYTHYITIKGEGSSADRFNVVYFFYKSDKATQFTSARELYDDMAACGFDANAGLPCTGYSYRSDGQPKIKALVGVCISDYFFRFTGYDPAGEFVTGDEAGSSVNSTDVYDVIL